MNKNKRMKSGMNQSKINDKKREKLSELLEILKKKAMYSSINYKHAAALIYKGEVINLDFNKFVRPVTIYGDNNIFYRTIHAEVNVLCSYHDRKNIKGMDIVVIRVSNNKLKNSRPCNNCILKLNKMGIFRVYYSNESGEIVYEYVKDMPNEHISSGNYKRFL